MSQVIRCSPLRTTLNGKPIDFSWPGRLYDKNGADITGRSFRMDLDAGWVECVVPLVEGEFTKTATGNESYREQHPAPLRLVDQQGRVWEGKE
jgi:hypothetical protein